MANVNEPRLYRRLTRTWPGFAAYHSLWIADDHVLHVSGNGWSERYQRFYFRDIKGLWIARSSRFHLITGLTGGVAALSGIPLLFGAFTSGVSYFALACFAPAFAGLLVNLLLGPTCRVFVLTGIQTEQLRVLGRTSRARTALLKLEPRIQEFQAALVPPPLAPSTPASASLPAVEAPAAFGPLVAENVSAAPAAPVVEAPAPAAPAAEAPPAS